MSLPTHGDQTVIAVDPHKASWTAVAVDRRCQPLASIRVEVNRDGYRQLRRFARRWPKAVWAIEGARGLGAPLAQRLADDGIESLDVPAKLAHRVRMLSTGHGRKTDEADALSIGIAALNSDKISTVRIDDTIEALRTLTEHRDDLIRTRTQTANRLHGLLTRLVPAGLSRGLTADAAAQMLRSVRPRDHWGRTLRQIAVDLVGELRRLDRRIEAATGSLTAAVTESRSQLTTVYGIGVVVAAKILAHTGDVRRFRSAAAFASYCGAAPIEVSSGDVQRHRLSRAGDRQLNYALHVIAITQIRRDTQGRDYYQRKRAAGKSHKEALRCL
ncbi:IS110 family transposase, partial [Nocardia abscessus]|uniref:IS110 family transposase n=1 Tax=Nocardia abscessus TaxID=120957 RepID=UPI002458164A